jgi:hypothetical protein
MKEATQTATTKNPIKRVLDGVVRRLSDELASEKLGSRSRISDKFSPKRVT